MSEYPQFSWKFFLDLSKSVNKKNPNKYTNFSIIILFVILNTVMFQARVNTYLGF